MRAMKIRRREERLDARAIFGFAGMDLPFHAFQFCGVSF